MTDFNVPERPTLEDANPNLQQPRDRNPIAAC